jgi:predicted O-methyltransferase YrrM
MIMKQEQFFAIFGRPQQIADQEIGMVTVVEMEAILALARSFRCKHIAEIGVGTGANAASVLRSCPAVETYLGVDVPPGTVPSLEYQVVEVPAHAGHLVVGDPRFKLIVREGGSSRVSVEELVPCDFVFIDGDHGVDAVRSDTALARRAIPEGVICWHDYDNFPAVGPTIVIDDLNVAEGDRICHLEGTTLCFEVRW